MNMKRFFVLLLTLVIVASLVSCGCEGHVDANDDYVCDNCGEDFDDGLEGVEVSFSIQLEDGQPLSGVTLLLEDDEYYEIALDSNGCAVAEILPGIYDVSFDGPYIAYTKYVEVDADSTSFNITVMDNTPDGSVEKPFFISEKTTELSLAPGQEIFFNYLGKSIKYAIIEKEGVIVNFNGQSYGYDEDNGVVRAPIDPSESDGRGIVFSVKNCSEEQMDVILHFIAPVGSSENPIVVNDNNFVTTVNADTEMYFIWTADKDGTLVLTTNSDRNNIHMIKTLEGNVPVYSYTDGANTAEMKVCVGDVITIVVTVVAPNSNSANTDYNVTLDIYLEVVAK